MHSKIRYYIEFFGDTLSSARTFTQSLAIDVEVCMIIRILVRFFFCLRRILVIARTTKVLLRCTVTFTSSLVELVKRRRGSEGD